MKNYLALASLCTILFGSSVAFADTVADTVTAIDVVYNPGGFTGTIATGATGTDATISLLSPVSGDPFTVNLTNSSGIITDSLFSNASPGGVITGDALEFDGFLSGNSLIGTTCVASDTVACVLNTGGVIDLAAAINSVAPDGIFLGGDITVQATDGGVSTSAVPEPSSLVFLGTGLAGITGVIRRRLFRAA